MSRTWTMRAVAAAAAVLVVAAGVLVLRARSAEGPEQAVDAYLGRWSRGEWTELQRLVADPPAEFRQVHEDMSRDLRITARTFERRTVRRDGDRATVTFAATQHLSGLEPWRYDGVIDLGRVDGDWRVRWTRATIHPRFAPGLHFGRTRSWPERAPINAADGTAVTAKSPVVSVGIEPRRVQDRAVLTGALQQHAGVDPARVNGLLDRPGLRPDVFVPVIDLREERYATVRPHLQPVPGLVFRRTTARLTPSEAFARHTVGRVGEITADRLKELGEPYLAGDQVGLTGLEAARERELAGRPSGEVRLERDGTNEVVATLGRFEGTAGVAVATTLDPAVQVAADRALEGVTLPAALVAVDIGTGAVRAVASRPLDQSFNRALAGRYPPGSTFKIVTTAALLAEGTAPDAPMSCPPEATVGGKRFRNFEGESAGTIPLRQAFAHSCNTAFVQAADRLPDDRMGQFAERFGFGADLSLPVTAVGGQFPAPKDDAERAAAAIGQARVEASPLHMATVAAAAASGTWRPPSLLAGAEAAGTGPPLDPATVAALRAMLREVVSGGTGTAANVPGREVAGKTGTAEFGTEVPPRTHAWFAGFHGSIAFAVLVEGGGVGGRDAAPLAARFVAALPR